MANLAFRSFTTLGYFAAALLIAIVAVLALTSFGDDSSGQQPVGTSTPAPTRGSASPGGDVGSISEGIEAASAGGIVEVRTVSTVSSFALPILNAGGASVLIREGGRGRDAGPPADARLNTTFTDS